MIFDINDCEPRTITEKVIFVTILILIGLGLALVTDITSGREKKQRVEQLKKLEYENKLYEKSLYGEE